jgi:hypothetical protein
MVFAFQQNSINKRRKSCLLMEFKKTGFISWGKEDKESSSRGSCKTREDVSQ